MLLTTDQMHSCLELALAPNSYTAFGYGVVRPDFRSRILFNGELLDAVLDGYLLGHGYRVYNPILMRFHSPDRQSPFLAGGLNSYAYCLDDPVNMSDPTGQSGRGRGSGRPASTPGRTPPVSGVSPTPPRVSGNAPSRFRVVALPPEGEASARPTEQIQQQSLNQLVVGALVMVADTTGSRLQPQNRGGLNAANMQLANNLSPQYVEQHLPQLLEAVRTAVEDYVRSSNQQPNTQSTSSP